ncbi:MAG: 2-keto-4-pentenoate hydratase/2-oxohepta-3-ene,7-dioic acid hydratase [Naasia sp.]|uniref:fumarylacetoacetate hydrolase family protein n=1 Tax=Naasia sp. TaxID=2546198 RepID=UPI00260E6681|nr:fumarylacetoacetate hydrolase family protein [Naasia sp.]MCU1571312.1 2-keto-4-pentenoate hydratase/2-oxohepta-3-ene,7-dioic acid hydratase [Naasia sp.]
MTTFRRLGPLGAEIPVVDVDGTAFDLRSLTGDLDGAFLAAGGLDRARRAAAAGDLEELPGAEDLRVGAPVARPGAVLCIGQNYAAHAAESGSPTPTIPILFFKHPNTVVGPYDDVILPPGATELDWEVELGVVLGSRTSYLGSPDEALAHVAGYVVSHDVSERVWQLKESGGQWSKGKIGETFNPLGPVLVPADEVGDPQRLRLWSSVNGEPRQDSNTSDMVFSVAELVHHLSQYSVLDAGDLINTGTPEGVALSGRFPYLKAGDVVELGIEGLGVARQTVVARG